MTNLILSLLSSGIAWKVFAGMGFLAYIYSLYARFKAMEQALASQQVQAKIKNDMEKIADTATHVTETERDFEAAVKNFDSNNTNNTPSK